MYKVLMIGQLPKEAGGNYTTGAAKVLFELSKQHTENVMLHTFATNLKNSKAKRISQYSCEYIGYRYLLLDIIIDILCHPIKTIKEWQHYMRVDHDTPFRYALYKANIKRAIKEIQPDIIHVHSIGNVSPVRFALGSKNTPLLLTCHGIFYRGESKGILRDRHLGNIGLADYYSGLTEESKHEYETLLGVRKDRVAVIPNGVDCAKFYYDIVKRRELRTEMGLADDTTVFITVASLQERKGQLAFIRQLANTNFNYQYWLIGSGPEEEDIKSFIIKHNLQLKVLLLGYKNSDELYKYYSAADVYAHVSTMEGQALCEIEARATGLRVVVNETILGTLPEFRGDTHFVINMVNPDLKAMALWIKSSNTERQSNNSLDWSVVSKRYAQLYQDILNCHNK